MFGFHHSRTALVCLVLASCVQSAELDELESEVAVTWTNAVGVTATGDDLTKTAANGWGNAGASSTQSLSGDGFVQFTTAESNLGKSLGLSADDADQDYDDIDFSIHLGGNGRYYVIEGGVSRGQFGTYAAGDVFRVDVRERIVSYSRNGLVFYTSSGVPFFPLVVDTALFHTNATLLDVDLSAGFWQNVAGVTVNGASLTKTAPNGWGNAGAITSRSITQGNGFVQFTTAEANRGKIAGLSTTDANQSYNTVRFGILLGANAAVQVYESGTLRGTFGTYTAGMTFRVAYTGGQVQYSRDGTVFYTSTLAPAYPAFADVALFTTGATVQNVTLEESFWANVVGAEAIGNRLVKTAADGYGNAGAVSLATIVDGDGHVEFSTAEANRGKSVGLGNADTDQSYEDIEFAIQLGAGGSVQVYEAGVPRGSFGNYAPNDVFRVAVVGGVVQYLQNGTVFYTSAVAPTYPLVADAALFSQGASVTNVSVVEAP